MGEVQPGSDDSTLFIFGFTERFPQRESVLNAARYTKQKSLLDIGLDESVLDQEFLQSGWNYGEENLSQRIGDGNRAELRWIIKYPLGLLKEHNKSNSPIARDVPATEDFKENQDDVRRIASHFL